jgi:hypothetical protein
MSKEKCIKSDFFSNSRGKKHIFPREMPILPRYSAQKRSNSPREMAVCDRNIYMKAATFKEILGQFLEQNHPDSAKIPSENEPTHTPSSGQLHDFAFVLVDQAPLIFPRSSNPYVFCKTPKKQKAEKTEKPNPHLKLSDQGQMAMKSLLRLGGVELESGLSPTLLKKVYRRLLKFYHPDHQHLDQLPEEQKRRSEQFFELRNSFLILEAEIARHSGLA